MNSVFEILPSSFGAEKCTLICEVNNEGFSFCIKDSELNIFIGLGIYHFDNSRPAEGFPIALQVLFHQKEFLSKNFKKVCIVYSFPQSVLIPFSIYKRENNKTMMNMMFGDVESNETILTDVITAHSMYNCYRLSPATIEVMQTQFKGSSTQHQYSLLLNNPVEGQNKMCVIFYARKVVVDLIMNGKHQLINSYNYQSSEDISYILLNIKQQFKIKNIHLEISGLIEKNSALYKEIYKYFDDIELSGYRKDIAYTEEIKGFPSHYFSYLFEMDSCE
jgi:hypothetical protein